jgi:asparagine synthase (glutamine-hydrolysing)
MCGITGFVSKDKDKEQHLRKMLDRIIHRGPDDEGTYIDEDVALGHRRLSIIDLNTGKQPIYNEDGSICVIFNGEIYNYQAIKEDLIAKGHTFKTTSDTEVLIHGYEEYKYDLLPKLRGMFAFVIWDKNEKELFGARDHFGIKPLYYYHRNDIFMFASEIKAFLDHPDFKKKLNKNVIPDYLVFNYTPTNDTLFDGVHKLAPGHYFVYKNNKLKVTRYFNLTFNVEDNDFNDIVSNISTCMKDSVEKHMISDVEVGSFLSSGIDSSYLVSLAKPDKTYTVGYDIPKYDEIKYAKDLADLLNINNTSKVISKQEYFDVIPKIMYHMDEPLADPAAVALYFVAELASKDVKVVLSGEGADELFGGYNTYRKDVDYSLYNKIPFFIRHFIASVCKLLPEVRGINFLIRRGQKLEESYIGVNKVFSERDKKKIINFKYENHSNKDLTKWVYDSLSNQDDIIKMQAIDINFWLIKDILQKADKMTMAHSIEGRVPFTDIEVFNLARTLPDYAKVTKENTKVALRMAAKEVIPNESYNKKKLGFPVPLREWLRDDDAYDLVKKSFDSEISIELFNHKRIMKLLDEHHTGKKDNYKKIWALYCFIVWYHEFFA